MYNAASGIQQGPSQRGTAQNNATVEISPRRFKIFFPSQQTVRQSRGGPEWAPSPRLPPLSNAEISCACSSGGTICLMAGHWENPSFPQELLFDCINKRKGLLMHNKVSSHPILAPFAFRDRRNCIQSQSATSISAPPPKIREQKMWQRKKRATRKKKVKVRN
jgi:hypothetical protein